MPQIVTQIGDYVWSNKEWLFSGVGVVALGLFFSFLRFFFLPRALPYSNSEGSGKESNSAQHNGHRFEFKDGIVAYAKLRGSWDNEDPFAMYAGAKSEDDFVRKMASLVYARAAYHLEKYSYAEAKARRREIELALVEELKPEYERFGSKLRGITIGTFYRRPDELEAKPSKEIPLGTQTKRLSIEVNSLKDTGISWAEILLSYRVTNPYDFLYFSPEGPYAPMQPVIESEVRFQLATVPLETLGARRMEIEESLLLKFGPLFKNGGMAIDSVKILDAH